MGESRGVYRVLVGKLKGNMSVGRFRRRREDNIKTGIQEVGWGMDWIDLAQDKDRWWALVNVAANLRVPQTAGNFLTNRGPTGLSRKPLLHVVS
jgi:hypothetical protein